MHDHTQSHIKNAQPGPLIFGDLSVNSKPISLKFCIFYLNRKIRPIKLISKVRPFDM